MHDTRQAQDTQEAHDAPDGTPRTGALGAGAGGPGGESIAGAVDVHLLAERIYRLMQAEVRLERARGHATTHTPSHTRR